MTRLTQTYVYRKKLTKYKKELNPGELIEICAICEHYARHDDNSYTQIEFGICALKCKEKAGTGWCSNYELSQTLIDDKNAMHNDLPKKPFWRDYDDKSIDSA